MSLGLKVAKGNQSWIFIGRTDSEGETPIIWSPDSNKWHIWKDSDAWKDWRQEEKRTTEDEMVGWNHWLDGHEFEYAQGIVDGQGSVACCSPWGHKELDKIQKLNWTKHKCRITYIFICKYNDAGFTTWYIAFFISLHENMEAVFLTGKVEFSPPHAWKSGWWFSTIRCRHMYISHMKIMALKIWILDLKIRRTGMKFQFSLFHKWKSGRHCFFIESVCISQTYINTKSLFNEICNVLYHLYHNLGANFPSRILDFYGRKSSGTKKPLDESERGEWKGFLKAQHSEN